MNIIQHVVEPEKLVLVWMPPLDQVMSRSNLAVARIGDRASNGVLTYLKESNDYQMAEKQGFHGYPAFRTKQDQHYGVLGTFLRRLPPRDRSDFSRFLEYYRLPVNRDISDFALLANTGGKLPRDGFSIIPNLSTVDPPCELLMEVAGHRHSDAFKKGFSTRIGSTAHFELEPSNPFDPNAIQIFCNEHPIGYVNRLQTGGVKKWLDGGRVIKANIDRINGTPERPIIYLFMEVK